MTSRLSPRQPHRPPPDVIRRACLSLAICLASAAHPISIAAGNELDLRPTSSRAARREAAEAIPLEKLAPNDRRTVQQIVSGASLYRRLPTKVIECDPRLFSLFMEHPETMVNLWEVLGISKVRMTASGENTFTATDGNGTQGTIRIVESICDDNAQNRSVVVASGTYQGGGATGPVRADCVALVRSGSMRDRDGASFVTARIDVFIHIDQAGIELLAKTFQPLLVRVADRNFEQTMDFVSSFSEAAEKNPRGVERLASRLDNVPPSLQARLTEIAYTISDRHAAPTATPAAQPKRSRAANLAQAQTAK